MRSANKKFGNVADVEVLDPANAVIEAWDAKYKKPYLYDELTELNDKIASHKELNVVGFVTDKEPDMREDVKSKIQELNDMYGIPVMLLSFDKWLAASFKRAKSDPNKCAKSG